eukprot:c15862_g1_i1.p2 GENE.c15862_g1_i1~~c15862_g1_i1.p2  ORF type:complete len:473 (+),score=125.12 c15862_g1_i1:2081-3499(+)
MKVAVLALIVAAALGQGEVPPALEAYPSQEQPAPPITETYTAPSDAGAALTGLHVQKTLSEYWANTILNLQSASGWLATATAWGANAISEVKQAKDAGVLADLEERYEESQDPAMTEQQRTDAKNFEEFLPLHPVQYYPLYGVSGEAQKEGSADWRTPLLYVLKINYLQTANNLANVHQQHYQMRVQTSQMTTLGNSPIISQLIFMTYYKNYLDISASSLAVQRYDAWSYWLHNEQIAAEVFDDRDDNFPEAFQKLLSASKLVAMKVYRDHAATELQSFLLEMTIKAIIAQASGASPIAGSLSMMEVESASAPFVPFLAATSPTLFEYYAKLFRLYERIVNYQAAVALADAAKKESEEYTQGLLPNAHATATLQQWALLNYYASLYEYYKLVVSLQGGAGVGSLNAPYETYASNAAPQPEAANLVQTEKPAQSQPQAQPQVQTASNNLIATPAQPAPVAAVKDKTESHSLLG